MILKFYKKERDIKGMLKHSILLAEKAVADIFMNEALVSYDESVKVAAAEEGIQVFSKLDPAAIVKHLSDDGTRAAKAAKGRASRPSHTAATSNRACFKFNFTSGGCSRSRCNYPHKCSACSGPGDVNADCPNVDCQSGAPSRK